MYSELAEARGWQPWLSAAKVLLPPGRHGKLQAGDGFTYTAKYVPGFVSAKVWTPRDSATRSCSGLAAGVVCVQQVLHLQRALSTSSGRHAAAWCDMLRSKPRAICSPAVKCHAQRCAS